MTAPARIIENKNFTLTESIIDTVTTPIDLEGIDATKPHCSAGIQFFDDAEGLIVATPSAGNIQVRYQTVNTVPVREKPTPIKVPAGAPETLVWTGNTISVRSSPFGVIGANFYRMRIVCNLFDPTGGSRGTEGQPPP